MNEPHSWGGSSWRELDREQRGLERGNYTGERDKGLRLGRGKAGRQQAGRKAGRAGQKRSQAGGKAPSCLQRVRRWRSQIEGETQS